MAKKTQNIRDTDWYKRKVQLSINNHKEADKIGISVQNYMHNKAKGNIRNGKLIKNNGRDGV